MNKCNYCNVFIKDETERCPLCGGVLEGGEIGEDMYPNVLKKEKTISFVFRLMVFISIVSIITFIGISITTGVSAKWSIFLTCVFLYVLMILYMFVRENAGYRVRMYGIVAGAVALLVMIDYVSGWHGWSVDYTFPIAIILMDIALIVLMIVNHRNWQSYIILMICMVPISVVPIILYFVDIITSPYMSQIAFMLSLFMTLGVIIIGGPRAKQELYRRFHILGK